MCGPGSRGSAKHRIGRELMSRRRLTIGTVGDITTRKVSSGRFESRTPYCDWDGKMRQVQSTGYIDAAAKRASKALLVERSELQPADTTLTPDGLLQTFVTYLLADVDIGGRIYRTTSNL
jgi:hypothetical protein